VANTYAKVALSPHSTFVLPSGQVSGLTALLAAKADSVHVHAKADISGTGTWAVSDIPTLTLSKISDAGSAASKSVGNAVGNVPLVEAGGTLNAAIVPSVPATHVYVDANQAAMLAHGSAVVGDISKRTDTGTSFILQALPSSTLGNWVSLTDASSVTSVNTLSGAVVLTTSNINEGSNLYYTTARANTDAPNVTLNAAADAIFGLTGQQVTLDTQAANRVFAGPTTGAAAAPTMRALVALDIPTHTHAESDVTNLVSDLAGKAAAVHGHIIADVSGLQLALDGKVNVGSTEFDARYYTETESNALFASKGNLAGGNEWLQQQIFYVSAGGERALFQASGVYAGTMIDVKNVGGVSKFTVDAAGNVNTVTVSGDGSGLTNLSAGNLTGSVGAGNLPAATALASGIVELATPAEATTGTDTVRAVTPEGLAASVAATAATKAPIGVLALGTVTTAQAPNVAGKNTVTLTLGAASVTINAPTNPTDGQSVVYEIKQDATGNRAVSWSTGAGGFQFGTDVTATTLSTGAGAIDLVGTRYNAASNKWRIVSFLKGFA
jgi:hypothetical protein